MELFKLSKNFRRDCKAHKSRCSSFCIHTDEKTHRLGIPPFGRLSSPMDNFKDSIETLSPYEGSYHRILILVDFNWFTNDL